MNRKTSGDDQADSDVPALPAAFAAREAVIDQMAAEGGWDYVVASSGARIGALAYGYVAAVLRDGSSSVSDVAAADDGERGAGLAQLRDAAVTAELTAASDLFNALEVSFGAAFEVGAKLAVEEFSQLTQT